MFCTRRLRQEVPLLSRHMRSTDEELARALPWIVRGAPLPDGSVAITPLSWERQRLARVEAGTGRLFVVVDAVVLAVLLATGMVVDVFDVRRDSSGAYLGEAAGAIVQLSNLQDVCVHGSSARVVGRVRVRLGQQDSRTGAWAADCVGAGLGLPCCVDAT